MNLPNIISKVYHQPWCILPEKHAAIRAVVEAKLTSGAVPQFAAGETLADGTHSTATLEQGGVAVIPVHGIIGKHLSGLETMCGGFSLEQLTDNLEAAIELPEVHSIVLDIRSPGGTVTGVPEAAAEVAAAAAQKNVVAYIDDIGASAAYWLASQATQIAVAPSAEVGSIGVYSYFLDETVALEASGIKVNEFKSGKFKTMGASYRSITPEEAEMLQADVDRFGAMFREAVSASRPIAAELMEGQTFTGQQAVENGLADTLHNSLKSVVAELAVNKVVG